MAAGRTKLWFQTKAKSMAPLEEEEEVPPPPPPEEEEEEVPPPPPLEEEEEEEEEKEEEEEEKRWRRAREGELADAERVKEILEEIPEGLVDLELFEHLIEVIRADRGKLALDAILDAAGESLRMDKRLALEAVPGNPAIEELAKDAEQWVRVLRAMYTAGWLVPRPLRRCLLVTLASFADWAPLRTQLLVLLHEMVDKEPELLDRLSAADQARLMVSLLDAGEKDLFHVFLSISVERYDATFVNALYNRIPRLPPTEQLPFAKRLFAAGYRPTFWPVPPRDEKSVLNAKPELTCLGLYPTALSYYTTSENPLEYAESEETASPGYLGFLMARRRTSRRPSVHAAAPSMPLPETKVSAAQLQLEKRLWSALHDLARAAPARGTTTGRRLRLALLKLLHPDVCLRAGETPANVAQRWIAFGDEFPAVAEPAAAMGRDLASLAEHVTSATLAPVCATLFDHARSL